MSQIARCLTLVALLFLGAHRLVFAQDVSVKLGVARTLHSTLLNEDRKVLVHLPASYDTSGKSYPVLYLLDGTPAFLLEMIAITNRLRYDRNAPEVIIVAVVNGDRNRDMMPVVAKGLPGPPGAEAFLGFLEKELVPEIDKTYRTAQPRILQGKSLSGLFTIYALLARPTAFDAYIACSAGWFAENDEYFRAMSTRAFETVESFAGRRVFMANSLRDEYDRDQTIHRQMIEFSRLLENKLGKAISYKYETYQDHPHVPFPCLYDGLRFVTADRTPAVLAAQQRDTALEGVWRFVEEVDRRADGSVVKTGPAAGYNGLLIFTSSGYMSSTIMPKGRTWKRATVTSAELRNTFEGASAHAGRYEPDLAKRTVRMENIASLDPADEGNWDVVGYRVQRDTLELSGPWTYKGEKLTFTMRLARVK